MAGRRTRAVVADTGLFLELLKPAGTQTIEPASSGHHRSLIPFSRRFLIHLVNVFLLEERRPCSGPCRAGTAQFLLD